MNKHRLVLALDNEITVVLIPAENSVVIARRRQAPTGFFNKFKELIRPTTKIDEIFATPKTVREMFSELTDKQLWDLYQIIVNRSEKHLDKWNKELDNFVLEFGLELESYLEDNLSRMSETINLKVVKD